MPSVTGFPVLVDGEEVLLIEQRDKTAAATLPVCIL